jgi:hypothetical protein
MPGSIVYRASIERITQWRPDLIGNRADRPQAIDMNFMMLYSIYMQYNLVEVIPNHFEYAMTQVLHTVCSIVSGHTRHHQFL